MGNNTPKKKDNGERMGRASEISKTIRIDDDSPSSDSADISLTKLTPEQRKEQGLSNNPRIPYEINKYYILILFGIIGIFLFIIGGTLKPKTKNMDDIKKNETTKRNLYISGGVFLGLGIIPILFLKNGLISQSSFVYSPSVESTKRTTRKSSYTETSSETDETSTSFFSKYKWWLLGFIVFLIIVIIIIVYTLPKQSTECSSLSQTANVNMCPKFGNKSIAQDVRFNIPEGSKLLYDGTYTKGNQLPIVCKYDYNDIILSFTEDDAKNFFDNFTDNNLNYSSAESNLLGLYSNIMKDWCGEIVFDTKNPDGIQRLKISDSCQTYCQKYPGMCCENNQVFKDGKCQGCPQGYVPNKTKTDCIKPQTQLSGGAIAGIVIGSIIFVGIVSFLIYKYRYKINGNNL
jgi:hypothetical protein